MKDLYKELLLEIDDIGESRTLETVMFTYGSLYGRVTLLRELKLISADQMTHIQKVADETLEEWLLFFN